MIEKDILLAAAMFAFNVPVFFFTKKIVAAADFTHIVAEKESDPLPAPADGSPTLVGSSARLASLMASIVLCSFLWGAGNYVIYAAFFEADKIATFLSSIMTYFMGGATIYAPYGVNKLTGAFKG